MTRDDIKTFMIMDRMFNLDYDADFVKEHRLGTREVLETIEMMVTATQIASKEQSVRNELELLINCLHIIGKNADMIPPEALMSAVDLKELKYTMSTLNVINPTQAVIDQACEIINNTVERLSQNLLNLSYLI